MDMFTLKEIHIPNMILLFLISKKFTSKLIHLEMMSKTMNIKQTAYMKNLCLLPPKI